MGRTRLAAGGTARPALLLGLSVRSHLAEISANVAPGAHAVLTIDDAGWHQTGGKLRVPKSITLLHLHPTARS